MEDAQTLVYGPVPSRRLGRSLGVNHIPAKHCTLSCVYCQVGPTRSYTLQRRAFYPVETLYRAVAETVERCRRDNQTIDYISLVPDGEPCLDIHLGRLINRLQDLDLPVAVISNSTLITDPQVRRELALADCVSLKIDAVDKTCWSRVDRPHGTLSLPAVLDGILAFANTYRGTLLTETMLIQGRNDGPEHLAALAAFIGKVRPATAYLAVPTRPPTVATVRGATEDTLAKAYALFQKQLKNVEYLIGYEGNAFSSTGDARRDLLAITAVHPMRKQAVQALLDKTGQTWQVVEDLLAQGRLTAISFQSDTFYLRRFTDSQ